MNISQLIDIIDGMHHEMDAAISGVETAGELAQKQIYKTLLDQINEFELSDGRFIIGQNYARRFAYIQKKIEAILGEVFAPSVNSYLNTYSTVEQTNIEIQKAYNDIDLTLKQLSPARQTVYKQAEYFLTEALADAYVQPAKYLLMQQVATGTTIKDTQRILRNWDEGKLTDGRLTSGRQTPRLQAYASQIATDSIYKHNGTINEIVRNEFGLNDFIYNGTLVKDSRPLCVHLVQLRRIISLDEIPALIAKYPAGLYPNTSKKNFMQVCGGYHCEHTATAVKKR